jgi:hypothetical protein
VVAVSAKVDDMAREIGSEVTFQLSDSPRTNQGTIIDTEEIPYESVYSPGYTIYVVRDSRRGWVYRLYERDLR